MLCCVVYGADDVREKKWGEKRRKRASNNNILILVKKNRKTENRTLRSAVSSLGLKVQLFFGNFFISPRCGIKKSKIISDDFLLVLAQELLTANWYDNRAPIKGNSFSSTSLVYRIQSTLTVYPVAPQFVFFSSAVVSMRVLRFLFSVYI